MSAKKKTADFTQSVPCYVCGALEERMPKFHAYPVCTKCSDLRPGEILRLDREQQKRLGVAIACNHLLPDLGTLLTNAVSDTLGLTRRRRPRRISR